MSDAWVGFKIGACMGFAIGAGVVCIVWLVCSIYVDYQEEKAERDTEYKMFKRFIQMQRAKDELEDTVAEDSVVGGLSKFVSEFTESMNKALLGTNEEEK